MRNVIFTIFFREGGGGGFTSPAVPNIRVRGFSGARFIFCSLS